MEADRMIIEGFPGYDGEYELNIEARPFLTIEWSWIKRISGYMPGTINDGWAGRDPELFCAFAVVALFRAGKIPMEAAVPLGEAFKLGDGDSRIVYHLVDREDDAVPPGEIPEPSIEPNGSVNGSNGSSGSESLANSGSPALIPEASGDQTSSTTSAI